MLVTTGLEAEHRRARASVPANGNARSLAGVHVEEPAHSQRLSRDLRGAREARRGSHIVWRDASPDALAWSVVALAHEAQHASGILSEIQAECYGMHATAKTTTLLGRKWEEGRYLATVYWSRLYAWFGPSVSSNECRDGGDLHPNNQRLALIG